MNTGQETRDREPLTLWLRWPAATEGRLHLYSLAGRTLISDTLLPELASFPSAGARNQVSNRRNLVPARTWPEEATLTYRGPGWIDNRWLDVECRCSPAGYWLLVAEAGLFWVAPDGRFVAYLRSAADANVRTVVQVALGPALIMALALRGTWCLHASAVVCDAGVIALAGESGNGKSTLAASLGNGAVPGWQRLADDILPLEAVANGLQALPHFPQLKLPPDAQPAAGQREPIPLRAVYILSAPEAGLATPEFGPLSMRDAGLVLVRHTVAARLFGADLLARHVAFCTAVARRVPVRHLAVPRDLSLLPRVADLLVADLAVQNVP